LLDSGCSNHMTGVKSFFVSLMNLWSCMFSLVMTSKCRLKVKGPS